ncbi:hypothetical protein DM02DRAFT_602833 [Periconia macrospinosa]|uniref:RED-like N-terminal domain-containing protein n=1 Tax=Periconia macrospinosa TaxID=97972 RepID=A0A2V1D883_9PLEO|nr:hypothetical protein DM02DRAFT_602833 [Periconia macrospinosa]
MDNQEFRRLILKTSASPNHQHAATDTKTSPSRNPGTVLGARKHSSIPMTPRHVGRSTVQADFARQLAQRNAKANPTNKFRSVAPKGTKLAPGYTDRSKTREDNEEENEKAKRIKNLENSLKLGEIDRGTFENLVQEITGGEVTSTHLVKGLDRKLLERVRKGENVTRAYTEHQDEDQPDLEDEFDELAEQELGTLIREKAEKKGEMAPPPPVAGVKRSRADILADLKRQREEAATAAMEEHEKKYPTLGAGFRKVSNNGETTRIEKDSRGREILIITDAQGKEKRKVRKQRAEEPPIPIRRDLDDATKPINMHNLPTPIEEKSEDEDIFEGVGSTYNPLAGLDNEDTSSDEEGEVRSGAGPLLPETERGEASPKQNQILAETVTSTTSGDGAGNRASAIDTDLAGPLKRNYFAATSRVFGQKEIASSEASAADITVRAALQKVRTLDPNSTLINDPDSKEARLMKRARELAVSDRDMEDLDMGFGGSRFDDADEMEREGEKIKLSEWRGLGAEGEEDEELHAHKGGKKRKRGPKKKKGDKNSASDVLMVMERQKEKRPLG